MAPRRQSAGLFWHWLAAAFFQLTLCSLGSLAWETKDQALEQAVKLVHDPTHFGVSTLSTKYPDNHPVADLAGSVISGPEYFAPCSAETGSLLYLGLTVSQSWRNVLNSERKNATVSIASSANPAVVDPRHASKRHPHHWQSDRPSWRRGMPSKGRVTLFGHFELLNVTQHPEEAKTALSCYLDRHPDASHWAPNATESPHVPFWATFNVDKVYWVGGFGDEHYIGWFDSAEWNTAWKSHSASVSLSLAEDQSLAIDEDRSDSPRSLSFSASAEAIASHSPADTLPALVFQ